MLFFQKILIALQFIKRLIIKLFCTKYLRSLKLYLSTKKVRNHRSGTSRSIYALKLEIVRINKNKP